MTASEVFYGTSKAGTYNYGNIELYDMANFFSQSSHFTIIDSYSSHYKTNKGSTPGTYDVKRYKGDPIADYDPSQPGYKYWESSDDVGDDNDWIVVQCETEHSQLAVMGYSGLQKWQCKFQVVGNLKYLADPSDPTGVKYPKNHGVQRILVHRFAPYGGWDLEDTNPDFNPLSPPASGHVSTQNHVEDGGNASARDIRWIQIHHDGSLIRLARYNDQTRQFYQVMCVIGDVIPVDMDHMPMPRCAMGNGNGHSSLMGEDGNGRFLSSGTSSTNNGGDDYEIEDDAGGGIAMWDHNEELVESAYTMDQRDHWNYAVVNPHPGSFEIDMFPVMPIPTKTEGYWFTWPYVRKSYTLGTMLYDNKNWMSVGNGFGPLFMWDGSSAIY